MIRKTKKANISKVVDEIVAEGKNTYTKKKLYIEPNSEDKIVLDPESVNSLKIGSFDEENVNGKVFSYIKVGDFVKVIYERDFYSCIIVEKTANSAKVNVIWMARLQKWKWQKWNHLPQRK